MAVSWINEVTEKPVFDIRDFGAVEGSTAATDRQKNNDAFKAAIRAASPDANVDPTPPDPNPFPNAIVEPRGGIVLVPFGKWYLADTINIVREIILKGVSGAGREGAGSVLFFPSGKTGIIVHRYNTSPLEANVLPSTKQRQGRGDYSIISDVFLQMESPRTGPVADGIKLYARASIQNCFIKTFSRDGIHIVTNTTPAEETVINPANNKAVTDLNASNWEVQNVRVEGCGRHGFYARGNDSNVGRAIGLDCTQNLEWGIYDRSFLGNTYVACHTDQNGRVAPDPQDPANKKIYIGGAYKSEGASNRSLFDNCYAEGGQTFRPVLNAQTEKEELPSGITVPAPPTSQFALASTVVGGTYPDSRTKPTQVPPNILIAPGISGGQLFGYPEGERRTLIELHKFDSAPGGEAGMLAFSVNGLGLMQTGGSIQTPVHNSSGGTTAFALDERHSVIIVDAQSAATVKLPAIDATKVGRVYTIKKIGGANNVLIVPGATGQFIDGQPSVTLATQWQSVVLVSVKQGEGTSPVYSWIIASRI